MPEGAPKYPGGSLKYRTLELASRALLRAERLVRPRRNASNPPAAQIVMILEYMLPFGASLVMTPVYEALRRAGKTVIVATRGPSFSLLRHSPFIDHLLESQDPLTNLPGAALSLRLQLRRRGLKPDCVLTGSFNQRTRIALLGTLACRGWRGGYTILDQMYEHPLLYDWDQPRIANNLRLTALLNAYDGLLEPRAFYTQADSDRAVELLQPLRAGGKPILFAVTQSSRGQATGWHHERWLATLRHVQQVMGYEVVYTGTAQDVPYLKQLLLEAGGTSFAGQTSFPGLAALLAQADLVLSLDTGTMHLARAAKVPMVVLAPTWQRAIQWLPLGLPLVRILRGTDRDTAPPGYQLDEIDVLEVVEALEELARLYPQSEAARAARSRAGVSVIDHDPLGRLPV